MTISCFPGYFWKYKVLNLQSFKELMAKIQACFILVRVLLCLLSGYNAIKCLCTLRCELNEQIFCLHYCPFDCSPLYIHVSISSLSLFLLPVYCLCNALSLTSWRVSTQPSFTYWRPYLTPAQGVVPTHCASIRVRW